MGNFSSSNKTNEMSKLLARIEAVDSNKDGIISKKEFEQWKNTGLNDIIKNTKNDIRVEYEKKIDKLRDEYMQKLKELNKEVESLNAVNKDLEKQLNEKNQLIAKLGDNLRNDEDVNELVALLTKEQINRYVEDILADEGTNIPYFPDAIERQVYRNVFKLMFKVLNKILGSVSFELIGHKLSMKMVPHKSDKDA